MRCYICDANDQGLSEYRADGRIPTHFHTTPMGDIICDECQSWDDELYGDYNLMDEENDD